MTSLSEDALHVLQVTADRFALGLISNGASDTQREKLRITGIERHFGAVVLSGETGICKPDPAVFELALRQLGVAPKEALHVGDSLTSDVAGAKAAGVTAVWLNRAGIEKPADAPVPDYEIRSLTELVSLLD
jgi:putative hydrolase of the HAD superfamily